MQSDRLKKIILNWNDKMKYSELSGIKDNTQSSDKLANSLI